ncbi:FMN-binding protein [Krasilnikovia sp. M28-CT-15]|uniref:FMN-binding protein n=1 Tax=Krasilnikovia sp. M28-CT-15 TaxID=3373540 RepID=UPI003875C399
MRRITLWLFSTVAALVLLFSYRTSTMGAGAGTALVAAAPETGGADGATSGDATGGATPKETATSGDKTYPGSVLQTRWGPIQVTISVSGGRITDVAVPTYPNGNHRDAEINAYALPALRQATLAAQSADIDSISGATVTSDGYRQSLQSALDAAHL